MKSVATVTADPCPWEDNLTQPCSACGTAHARKPNLPVTLTLQKLRCYDSVSNLQFPNPFSAMQNDREIVVNLCEYCRSRSAGWGVIANKRRHGRNNSQWTFQVWISRFREGKHRKISECHICTFWNLREIQYALARTAHRNLCRDYTLFNISNSSEEVTNALLQEFS